MVDENPALEDRYVLFFDFLGARAAATTWPRDRIHDFVDLLISISQIQSTEAITGGSEQDGSYRLEVMPEITTFSDNIVVSYRGLPEDDLGQKLGPWWTDIVCQDAIRILSGVAETGLRLGLLIRGGLSFGQLFHDSGVVFGEGLVDAYRLESKEAKVPRVLVSERIIAKLTQSRPEEMPTLLKDRDGLWHLNYFRRMRLRAAEAVEPRRASIGWKRAHTALIDREIAQHREARRLREAEKWEWFGERFVEETAGIPDTDDSWRAM
jgi:hypothetical protein